MSTFNFKVDRMIRSAGQLLGTTLWQAGKEAHEKNKWVGETIGFPDGELGDVRKKRMMTPAVSQHWRRSSISSEQIF